MGPEPARVELERRGWIGWTTRSRMSDARSVERGWVRIMSHEGFERVVSLVKTEPGAIRRVTLMGYLEGVCVVLALVVLALMFAEAEAEARGPWPAEGVTPPAGTITSPSDPTQTPTPTNPNAISSRPRQLEGLEALAAFLNTYRDDPLAQFKSSLALRVARLVPGATSDLSSAIWGVLLGTLLALAAMVFRSIRTKRILKIAAEVASGLRSQLYRQSQRLSLAPGERRDLRIAGLLNRDVPTIRRGVARWLYAQGLSLTAVGASLLAIFIEPGLGLTLGGLGLATLALVDRFARRDEARRRFWTTETEYQSRLMREDFDQLGLLRSFNAGEFDRRRFELHLEDLARAEADSARSSLGMPEAVWPAVVLGTIGLAVTLIAVVGVKTVPATSALMVAVSMGIAVAAAQRGLRVRRDQPALEESAERILDYLARKSEYTFDMGAKFLHGLDREIRFERVTLTEGEEGTGRKLLDGLSMTIPARSRVAIVGMDAASRRGFTRLLPRLAVPIHGQIKIDDHDLTDLTLDSLRAQVGIVLGDELVFSDTIAVNIGLGQERHPLPRITEAAKMVHAHNTIRRMPQGYDTVIGPEGQSLPVDVEYRIALARLVLHDPSILVVAEPDAPFDEEAQLLIDDALERLAEGRTLIWIGRRGSFLSRCDRVMAFRHGRVEEYPSYEAWSQSSRGLATV